MGCVTRRISGWGNYPVETCRLYRPEKQSDLRALIESGSESSYISRGLGRSYGDAALNSEGAGILHTRLNRFLAFDELNRVLECEAGVSFAEILQYLLPRGFFLPVTPGTKFVTVGGAIAADIHGKNHHRDGSIAGFVLDLRLLLPSGEILTCSPSANSEIYWATIGGMGLTGIIVSARLRLRSVESAYVRVDYQKTHNLGESLDAMAQSDAQYEYSVAWIDCLARGEWLGRSILIRGNHACLSEISGSAVSPFPPPRAPKFGVPFGLPWGALNRFTVGAFNSLYFSRHKEARNQLVGFEKFFYPLDSIANWNRLYGKAGFVQYQFVLPEQGGREGLRAVLGHLAASRRASFLAVLKRMGEADAGLLSFPMKGYTLALDIPVTGDLPAFLHRLDERVLDYGGRIYLAKDAVLKPETFAASYPRLDQFRSIKQRLDPKARLSSSLARRLRIVDG
jgi:decaprenylphospho-beta-D-ribofuranose 2-oxidase